MSMSQQPDREGTEKKPPVSTEQDANKEQITEYLDG